jgi:hypothetical protein
MPIHDEWAKASCSAFSRSKVRQCIPLGLPPSGFAIPASHPSRCRIFLPVASLHHPFPVGTHRPTGGSADRQKWNRRKGWPRAAAPYGRAQEPYPPPAEVQARPFQIDGIFHRLPLAAVAPASVVQNDAVSFGSNLDGCHLFTIDRPMPAEGTAHSNVRPAPRRVTLGRPCSRPIAPTWPPSPLGLAPLPAPTAPLHALLRVRTRAA